MGDLLTTLELCGLTGESWSAWRAAARALTCAPMSAAEVAVYQQCTGRTRPPAAPVAEALFIVGRRGGKSRFGGALGVHAASQRYDLAPGERGVVGVAAADREQARVLLGYVSAPFQGAQSRWAALRSMVTRSTRWSVDLGDVSVEVTTSSFRRARGRTFAAAVCDEVAFWVDEKSGANPATEVLAAIRPALATLSGRLTIITTPFSKAGAVWDLYDRYFGVEDSPVLVWQAASRVMNPSLPQVVVDEAMRRDEASARAEYGAEFRDDLSSYVGIEALRRAVLPGRTELPPMLAGGGTYYAFCDAAGGSGQDSFTLAIAHGEQEPGGPLFVVLDVAREQTPPFSPEAVVAEYATLLRQYGLDRVVGDRYAGDWPAESFRRRGIEYRASARTKSELFIEFLPLLNSGGVCLLDQPKLLAQLQGLQRSAKAGGRDSVDHAAGRHDDVANAACGALLLAHAEASVPELIVGRLGR